MSRDTKHLLIALGALLAIGYGLYAIYAPLCPLLIGALLLIAVVSARRQEYGKPEITDKGDAE